MTQSTPAATTVESSEQAVKSSSSRRLRKESKTEWLHDLGHQKRRSETHREGCRQLPGRGPSREKSKQAAPLLSVPWGGVSLGRCPYSKSPWPSEQVSLDIFLWLHLGEKLKAHRRRSEAGVTRELYIQQFHPMSRSVCTSIDPSPLKPARSEGLPWEDHPHLCCLLLPCTLRAGASVHLPPIPLSWHLCKPITCASLLSFLLSKRGGECLHLVHSLEPESFEDVWITFVLGSQRNQVFKWHAWAEGNFLADDNGLPYIYAVPWKRKAIF